MSGSLSAALWAEVLKLRRSRVPWLTAAAMTLAPLLGALQVFALRHPAETGMLGSQAAALGSADWSGFLGFLVTFDAAGGLLVFGLLTAWVFGREFSDRTAIDLLALPTPRFAIVTAKFGVIAGWSLVLTALVLVLGLPLGAALGLPGWSSDALLECARQLVVASLLTVVLVTPFALVASVWRGYLPAVGLILLVMVLAQVLGQLAVGAWFPWSVPALAAGVAGTVAGAIGPQSYPLVALTAIAGASLNARWWARADHQ
jgi:ABC-2 type transport system permease protein